MADADNNDSAEIWKDIPGWECIYQVSNLGNCRALEHNGSNLNEIATTFGVSESAVRKVVRGETWREQTPDDARRTPRRV